jgi:conjugal transfer pilus assembly protein TraK
MRPRDLLALVAMPMLAATTPAHALQVINASDGVAVEAVMSAREPTRIRIEGAAIVDVFGSVQSSGCGSSSSVTPSPTTTGSELLVECDRDKGEIYVRPLAGPGDGSTGKPVNLFISSAHATYTLLLRRSDTPADTIVIRDRSQRSMHPDNAHLAAGPAPSHIRAMKTLLVAMASDRFASDVLVEEVHAPVLLWIDTSFTLLRRYEARGLVGEKFRLQNTGSASLTLSEPHFDRPDSRMGGQVVGVSIEHHELPPGAVTTVFVIRRGGQ